MILSDMHYPTPDIWAKFESNQHVSYSATAFQKYFHRRRTDRHKVVFSVTKKTTKNGYRKYREHLTKIRISKIWKEDGDLQEKYERWDRLVKEIKENTKQEKRKIKGEK